MPKLLRWTAVVIMTLGSASSVVSSLAMLSGIDRESLSQPYEVAVLQWLASLALGVAQFLALGGALWLAVGIHERLGARTPGALDGSR